MKRLTYKRSLDGFEDVGLRDGITVGDAICRLANYEDTGFEPEHISELLQAENDGRLAVLPCKVGDTVYYPSVKQTRCTAHGKIKDDDMCCGCEEKCDASTEPYIFSGEVARVEIIGDDVILVRCRFKEKYDNAGYVISKTVFLTRKEAEAALAMEGGNQ